MVTAGRTAVGAVLLALVIAPVASADPDPDMPTGPLDPRCAQFPTDAVCQGGPYALPSPPPPPAPPVVPIPPRIDTPAMPDNPGVPGRL